MARRKLWSSSILCALSLLWLATAGRAQVTYFVTVDTSPLNGTLGNLDLQFNPGGLDALGASVTITNFLSDGLLASSATTTGGASGTLPGPVTIANSSGFNDLFQGITFGNSLSFDATFFGPALSPTPPLPTSGSVFALSLYNAAGTAPLLTTSPVGSLLHIATHPNGSTSETGFPDPEGVVRATAFIPEPGTLCLLAGAALPGMALALRRRCRRAGPAARSTE